MSKEGVEAWAWASPPPEIGTRLSRHKFSHQLVLVPQQNEELTEHHVVVHQAARTGLEATSLPT